jgi:hypothetical protein
MGGAEFQFAGVHLYGDALPDKVNREDDPETALPAQYDAFHAGQRTRRDADSLPYSEIRMRLEIPRLKTGTEALDFNIRQ